MGEYGNRWDGLQRDQLIEELARANRRLSGTLKIILGTLDSADVTTLFSRVLEQLSETLEASGAIMYLAEPDGFHLRGSSSGMVDSSAPAYVAFGRTLATMSTRSGRAMRLRVLPPDDAELRQGHLTHRNVLDEDADKTYRVEAATLPPFTSLLAVPVWFGQHVIALIEVGWRQAHPLRREDAELLEAVTQYLSVQLVGAFSALRQQRESELREASASIRETLLAATEVDASVADAAFAQVAATLGATSVPAVADAQQGVATAQLPQLGVCTVPVDLDALAADAGVAPGEPAVAAVIEGSALHDWLRQAGVASVGALADVGTVADEHRLYLLLRDDTTEPFSADELAFVRRAALDVSTVSAGNMARTQDKRISQALQVGMRNELQHVAGITAAGVYSSATAAAFVGGDFYDLVALPERRACVVMGDVSGKGVEAASVSAAVRTAIAAYAWEGLAPARMVELLNNYLIGLSRLETFVTLFVGIIDLKDGLLTYCSAGHPPAILRRQATGDLVPLDVQSGVVGAFREMGYRNGTMELAEDDLLVLYTDGTTEARSPDGRFFGEDGLRDMLVRITAADVRFLPERLLSTLDDFTGHRLDDDVAVVALRFDRLG